MGGAARPDVQIRADADARVTTHVRAGGVGTGSPGRPAGLARRAGGGLLLRVARLLPPERQWAHAGRQDDPSLGRLRPCLDPGCLTSTVAPGMPSVAIKRIAEGGRDAWRCWLGPLVCLFCSRCTTCRLAPSPSSSFFSEEKVLNPWRGLSLLLFLSSHLGEDRIMGKSA